MTRHRLAGRKVNVEGVLEAVVSAGCKAGRIVHVNRSDGSTGYMSGPPPPPEVLTRSNAQV